MEIQSKYNAKRSTIPAMVQKKTLGNVTKVEVFSKQKQQKKTKGYLTSSSCRLSTCKLGLLISYAKPVRARRAKTSNPPTLTELSSVGENEGPDSLCEAHSKLSRGKSSHAALTTADAQVRAAMRLRITLSKENAKKWSWTHTG